MVVRWLSAGADRDSFSKMVFRRTLRDDVEIKKRVARFSRKVGKPLERNIVIDYYLPMDTAGWPDKVDTFS